MEAERQADLAEVAAHHARESVREVEGRLLDQVAAGAEADPALVAEHERALERLRRLENRADELGAARDAMTDESGAPVGVPLPASGVPAAPGGAAAPAGAGAGPAPAAARRPPPPLAEEVHLVEIPVSTRIVSAVNAESASHADVVYRDVVMASAEREAALCFDTASRQYVVIQGGRDAITTYGLREAGLIVLRHSHPIDPATGRVRDGDRFPSIEDMGALALSTPVGEMGIEHVDFQLGGGVWGEARFQVDKRGAHSEYSVVVSHGGTVVEQRPFDSLDAYNRFLFERFGAHRPVPEGAAAYDRGNAGDD